MITEQEKKLLLDAINKGNTQFSEIIMQMAEKYQIFSADDLALLCNRDQSRDLFSCAYSYLKKIDINKSLPEQLKSADGRNRYYSKTYLLNGDKYVMTSQLYGYGGNSHEDNRKKFHKWVLGKFGINGEVDTWWPSKEEFDPKLSKEAWKKFIIEVEKPKYPACVRMLKAMMELGGEATCKELSIKYGGHPSVYAACTMNIGRHVKSYYNLPSCMDGDKERYFPFPFLGKYNGTTADNYIYKIRPELYEALNEIDLSDISPYYVSEHKTGNFDSWEIIDDVTAIKTCDKSFFAYNGSGVPKEICWFFDAEDIPTGGNKPVKLIVEGKEFIGRLTNDTTDRRRIQIRWNSDLTKSLEQYKTDKSKAKFVKVENGVYEIIMEEGEAEVAMTIKDKIQNIKSYIAAKGFNYEGELIENFYLSLKSKPFVILAGTSGTGKTKLVKLFAEAIGAEMKLVPVRPDWSDSSDLFGHVDLAGNFKAGAIIDFVKQAELNKNKSYFLCLDEMNLARVEYYLSDFLSIIETRDRVNGEIITDPLVSEEYYQNERAKDKYGKLIIPENLYIIGTVNMDETTFPFSKKVLDRANTIEFSFVNFMPKEQVGSSASVLRLDNSFLKTQYLYFNEIEDEDFKSDICFKLEELNEALRKANLHVGYRVRDEISFYMINNKECELLDENAAFDNEIMQKILPRIQGSSGAIKQLLCDLFVLCAGDYSGFTGGSIYEQMSSYVAMKDCKYPNTAKKIVFMMRRYEEDGFTSYWL